MSIVSVTNVVVGRNPGCVLDPLEFEVSFECLEALQDDLEWKLTYVGSAEDKSKDQELDCVALGPIQRGALKFVFTADPPDFTKIDPDDVQGITVVLLTGSYKLQEFIRVGWYVHNIFEDIQLHENPPEDMETLLPLLPQMKRIILSDDPRVTRFSIEWDKPVDIPSNGIGYFKDSTVANAMDCESDAPGCDNQSTTSQIGVRPDENCIRNQTDMERHVSSAKVQQQHQAQHVQLGGFPFNGSVV